MSLFILEDIGDVIHDVIVVMSSAFLNEDSGKKRTQKREENSERLESNCNFPQISFCVFISWEFNQLRVRTIVIGAFSCQNRHCRACHTWLTMLQGGFPPNGIPR